MIGTTILDRSVEAESSILGALLLQPELYARTAGIVTGADFYTAINGAIYGTIGELYTKSGACDLTLLVERLYAREPTREKKEIQDYLVRLADSVPVLDNVTEYCRIVKNKAISREGKRIIQEAYEAGFYDDDGEPHGAIQALAENLANLIRDKNQRNSRTLREILIDVRADLFGNTPDLSIGTGIASLDRLMDGIEPQDLVVIGAATGVGKTAFALQLIKNMARKGKRVMLYSQEMSDKQNTIRLLARHAGIELYKLKKSGRLEGAEIEKATAAINELSELPIEIKDSGGVTVSDIRLNCVTKKDLDVIFVDHVGLMKLETGVRKSTRNDELAYIMTELRSLAMQIKKPIIALSQFNREGQNGEPELRSLRDCGEIEQSASTIVLLWRTADWESDGIIGVKVAKNRQGEGGKFHMRFNAPMMTFLEVIYEAKNYNRNTEIIDEMFGK